MKHDHPSRKELEVLLAGLVEGVLPAAQKTRLGELLKNDAEARLFYKRYLEVHAMLDWESGTVAIQQSDDDTLQDLLRMEQAAYAPIVEMPKALHLRVAKDKTPWELGGALRYLISRPATWTAAAAVLVLALILGIVFSGGDQPDNEIAQQPDITDPIEPGPVGPALNTAVATLTATHNAQWAERASARGSDLRTGSDLHAGDRLTLTQGFAEVTTNDGAVAIIEAPATVELLDNNNALRLHAGKLVGICETESSKGFTVHARDARIVDLGTEFGVEVSNDTVTATVFTGDIVLATPDHKPQPLTTNQTARVTEKGDGPSVVVEDRVTDGFTQRLPGAVNAQTVELTRMDQLDFTNVVKAYDFTGSDSLASDGASLDIGGVTFTRHWWRDGKTFDGLTLIDSTRKNNEFVVPRDNHASGAPTLNVVGSATDQANLNKLLAWWNIGMGQDNASLMMSIEVPDGVYKVQLITGTEDFRQNELFDIDAGDLGSGNEVALGQYNGGRGNYLITGTAIATGGTLDLKLFGTPGPGDGRPIVSGLIISAHKGGIE